MTTPDEPAPAQPGDVGDTTPDQWAGPGSSGKSMQPTTSLEVTGDAVAQEVARGVGFDDEGSQDGDG